MGVPEFRQANINQRIYALVGPPAQLRADGHAAPFNSVNNAGWALILQS